MNEESLIELAKEARINAYAPYSGFMVGAALLTRDGKVYTGCNVENASYGVTSCAERTAFFKAISEGERSFSAIAIVGGEKDSQADGVCAPCGVCRQVMREFTDAGEFKVIMCDGKGGIIAKTLEELLPLSFGPESLQ